MANINKTFECSNCKQKIKLTEEGNSFICPSCQTNNKIEEGSVLGGLVLIAIIFFIFFKMCDSGNNTNSSNVDVCRCLTEPGDSEFIQENATACRDAISKELGVANWEKINMSQNPDISAKFDALVRRCK